MSQQNSPQESDRPKGGLAFVATRPVAISMFILALGVFGVVSFKRLPVDLLPEISYPTLTVRTSYPGAAPEDVEDRISVRVQEALSTLPGLVRSTSISRAAFSDVLVEFNWGTQMTFAVQEVRDRLDGLFLPAGAERPLILRYDPNLDPILRVGVSPVRAVTEDSSDASFIQMRWIAENKIKRELESIEGVAAVNVRGGLEEEILVSVDPFRLDAQNIPASAITDRLAQENLNASGGRIREGSTDYLVRTLNEFKTIDEIRDLAVLRREGATIRVSDLAQVTRTHAEREVITRIDGNEAVEIAIYREAGANIVDVAERVRDRLFGSEEDQRKAREQESQGDGVAVTWGDRQNLAFLGWTLRKEARMELLSDQSTFIGAAIDDVKWAAMLGGVLAIAVMWIFLRKLSATLIIGLAIPISVLVTFAPMFLSSVSLNIMSLGGLALGIGMLVDNAIVVLESITRCREEGDKLGAAAVRGVREVSGAITASTLTTVAVFAPIVFVEGIAGQIFGDQALTVVSSLLVSLLVAILFIPMLASRTWLDSGGEKRQLLKREPRDPEGRVSILRWPLGFVHEFFLHDIIWSWSNLFPNFLKICIGRPLLFIVFLLLRALTLISALAFWIGAKLTWPVRKIFDAVWGALDVIYPRVLAVSLRHPFIILLAVGAGSWFAVRRAGELGLELIPEIHQGEFTAHVGLSVGTPILVSDRVFAELDREIRSLDPVEVTAMTVGVEQESLTRKIEGDHTARITVHLKPESSGLRDEELAVERVRALLQSHPEVRSVDVTRPTPFTIDSPLAVEVRGHDLVVLGRIAEQVRERMASIDGLTDVRTTMRPGHPEARITFDRDKTLEYGLDLGAVSDFVRDSVLGKVSTRFIEGDERIDIRVRGDQHALASIGDVYDLVVNPETENPVPLRSIAMIEEVRGPAEIRRIGNSRAVLVTAASTGLDLGGLTKRIEASLTDLVTPADVVVEIGGQKREMDEGMKSLQFALMLAIFLVYVVMASQFESLVQPLIILFSVPLAAVGVVLALDLLNISLSVVVFIGLILLAGIVVNNAIVLVDRINAKRRDGVPIADAILEAGRARLRPILMTTATTVLGLLPLTGWLQGLPLIGMLGAGEGAELRSPMAITVVTGLTSSTLLTLIVIPVIFSLLVRKSITDDPESPTTPPTSSPAGVTV